MNIAIAGMGYVGTAYAVMLARQHRVRVLEIDARKVDALNARLSPVNDALIDECLAEPTLNLQATLSPEHAFDQADYVLIATPSNFDPASAQLDTHAIELVIQQVMRIAPSALMVIKSTVPIGYTQRIREQLDCDRLIFSPEFLREGQVLADILRPSRIIIGERSARAQQFGQLLLNSCLEPQTPLLLTDSGEAESIKLFANSYLAMRVAFFNELDSLAMNQGLDTRQIIEGIGLDSRIGHHYNNPSFGYGGYCLPKDTQQLLSSFAEVPQQLIGAIVRANETRKALMVEQILQRKPQTVGFYRLQMKAGSDNFRHASVLDLLRQLQARGVSVMIYEPSFHETLFENAPVERELMRFTHYSDVIVCNRYSEELTAVRHKLFSRDVFGCD